MYNFESNFHTLQTVSHYKMGCYFHHLALGIDDLGTDYYYYYYYFELRLMVDVVVASEVYEFVAFCVCICIYVFIYVYVCIISFLSIKNDN